MIHISLDAGSCHMGELELAKELIDVAAKAGADSVKFQLGEVGVQNYELPLNFWDDLVEYANESAIEIFASVFDSLTLDWYLNHHKGVRRIKFSYSWRQHVNSMLKAANSGFDVIASCDFMSYKTVRKYANTVLFCIPDYPVMYDVRFDGVFPLFDGFSDHSMGCDLTHKAVKAGARYIEKHIKLDCSDCPDAMFALNPEEAKQMVKKIR